MAVEQASYQILLQEDPFELRLYAPMIVVVSPERDFVQQDGFSRLFRYISGDNESSRQIAMTAPVINSLDGRNPTTAFVMPKKFGIHDLPTPNDSALETREIPERHVAVVSFSGSVHANIITQKKASLLEWIQEKKMTTIGELEMARYNPPYIPSMLRRNELMIEVKL